MSASQGKDRADVLLHPVRLRIVTELFANPATPKELASLLKDIPQASLYRHIKLLDQAGILDVRSERTVNGAVERTYGVNAGHQRPGRKEQQRITANQHQRYFGIFMASLLDSLKSSTTGKSAQEIEASGLSYNQLVVYLSDKEREQLRSEMSSLITRFMGKPVKNRRRFTLASIVIPHGAPKP